MPMKVILAQPRGFCAGVVRAIEIVERALENGLKVRAMILPDEFIEQDTPVAMYAKAGLDAKGIVSKVFEALGRDVHAETVRLA